MTSCDSATCAQAGPEPERVSDIACLARDALSCADTPCAGDTDGYTGEAVNPENLSLWERVAGVGARYRAVRAAGKTADSAARASRKAAGEEPMRNGKA